MIITLYSTILIIFLFNFYSFADASTSWQIGFQDPATPYMEGILNFHNIIMFFIVGIVIFISWLLFRCLTLYNKELHPNSENFTHSTLLEIIWFIFLAFVITIIVILCLIVLNLLDYSFNLPNDGKNFLSSHYSYCDDFERKIIKLGKDDFNLLDCSPKTKLYNYIVSNELNKHGVFVFYDPNQNMDVFVFNLDLEIVNDMYSTLTGLTEISGIKNNDPAFVCVLAKKNFLTTLASLREDLHFFTKREDDLGQPELKLGFCNKFPILELFNINLTNSLTIIYNEYSDSYLLRVCLEKEYADRFYSISTGYSKIIGNKVNDPQCLCFITDPKFVQIFLKEN